MLWALGKTEFKSDIHSAIKTLADLESKFRVRGSKTVDPTVPFLNAIAEWIGPKATISQAWQLWRSVFMLADKAREKTEAMAELAYWFGIDPFKLSEVQAIGLLESLPKMQCQDRIHRKDFDPMDFNEVYYLYKTAFNDEDLAQTQKSHAFKLYVEYCTSGKSKRT